MRKLKYLVLLFLLGIITTGCVKFNASMDIKKDKSMDFTIVYAIDTGVFGESQQLKEEDFAKVKEAGFTINEYKDGTMKGFTLSKSFKNIDEVSTDKDVIYNLSGMMAGNEDSKYLFKVEKGFLKDTYTAVMKFDSNDSGLSTNTEETTTPDEELTVTSASSEVTITEASTEVEASSEEVIDGTSSLDLDNVDYSSMMAGMDLSFNVKLPYSAISNNATNAENGNKTLKWTLLSNKANNIEFKFAIYNMTIVYIITGVLLVIIVLVILLLIRKKGKKQAVLVEDNKVEIKNDTNDYVATEPELQEKANVMEDADQKDNG